MFVSAFDLNSNLHNSMLPFLIAKDNGVVSLAIKFTFAPFLINLCAKSKWLCLHAKYNRESK